MIRSRWRYAGPLVGAWIRWGSAVALLIAGCRGPQGDLTDGSETSDGTSSTGDGADAGSSDDGTSDDAGELDPSTVPEPKAARLTDLQYRYTVLDVLGEALTPAELDTLPTDIPTGRDYSTTVDPQVFNSNYVLAYAEIARSVSARLDPLALVEKHGDCVELDRSCRSAFIEGLGRRMFRRPLTDEEIARYLELAATIDSIEETHEEHVVRGLVQAMMQAPQFLYRLEREIEGEPGALRRLDGYELAARLSYFLWQSAPDEPLLAFAAGPQGDGVFDPGAVGAHIDRLIANARFARTRALFWGDYTLATRSSFATADVQLAAELRQSLLLTLDRISGADGNPEPLSAVFSGHELIMTPAVAEIAGAEPLGDGPEVYDTSQAEERLGVVTHPAFLASISTTSFVGRGLFLSERLLCQHVAQPPLEVEEEIESTAQATEGMTPREASEFRMGLEAVCLGCHTQFEPIAYGFERYDLGGRFTLTDAQGRELFSDGVLPAYRERPELVFADALELLTQLGELDAVHACFTENMTEFATGKRIDPTTEFHELTTADFLERGQTFDALARAVASSEQRSLLRVVEP